jgi:hypothetical protein
LSEIDRIARITPSASRSAMSWPGSTRSAKASDTSSVIGIGQSVPSAAHVLDDAVVIGLPMKPLSGLKPPFISSSRSQVCRGVRSHDGRSAASIFSFCALS